MAENLKTLKFPFINHEKEMLIEENLQNYLKDIGKSNLFASLSYILKEMVGNANKANLKRTFFTVKNLDINSSMHYDQGMKNFKDDLANEIDLISKESEKMNNYVRIDFYISNNNFIMSVSNTVTILPIEKTRIQDKINRAIKFRSMEEVFTEVLDTTEGAGFGLILTILTLRKLGLSEHVYKLTETDKGTTVTVSVPLSLLDREQEEFIAETVKKEINDIPQFPQHILDLQKILSDPNANFEDLSGIINKDASLITDLLKLANSSMYMLASKVKTIEEAVRQIGFKGVKGLILSYSTQKLLSDKYNLNLIQETMDHSIEVAFFAYEIARKFKLKHVVDIVYTIAIIHDFGKIIVNSLHPEILDRIAAVCNANGINSHVMENLTDGFNHSIIGASLAKKWNFSDDFIEAIKFHHIPLEASEDNQLLVFVIYLADLIYYYVRNKYDFSNINYHVLKFFNLADQGEFDKFANSLADLLKDKKENK